MTDSTKEALLAEISQQETVLRDLDCQRDQARARIAELRRKVVEADRIPERPREELIPEEPAASRACESPPLDTGHKMRLFRELFRGREDVYPKYRNCTEKSTGTTAWISRCRRLLDRWVAEAGTGDAATVRQAFDIIFGLLDRIDECREDIIFFADEAGSWQVGVHWDKVLPPWFDVLSATAEPGEYAHRITVLLKHHYHYGSAKMLEVARRVGTAAQGRALPPPGEDLR